MSLSKGWKWRPGFRNALANNEFILTSRRSTFDSEIVTLKPCSGIHPSKGQPIQPLKFISAAEESGLIVQIGKGAEDRMRVHYQAERQDIEKYGISVNISVVQLMQDFVDMVGRSWNRPLEPSELEITESKLVETVDMNLRKIHELRDLGGQVLHRYFGKGFLR